MCQKLDSSCDILHPMLLTFHHFDLIFSSKVFFSGDYLLINFTSYDTPFSYSFWMKFTFDEQLHCNLKRLVFMLRFDYFLITYIFFTSYLFFWDFNLRSLFSLSCWIMNLLSLMCMFGLTVNLAETLCGRHRNFDKSYNFDFLAKPRCHRGSVKLVVNPNMHYV
jgi:hypothetical protein